MPLARGDIVLGIALQAALVATLAVAAVAAEPEVALPRMEQLSKEYKSRELVAEFGDETFAGWPDTAAWKALQMRAQAHRALKNGARAEADFARAIELAPRNTMLWIDRGDNLQRNLGDDAGAMAAYGKVLEIAASNPRGWDTIAATIAMAQIRTDQVRPDEALALLAPFADVGGLAPVWQVKVLRCFGHVHAAAGREAESLAKFREALRIETDQKSPPTSPKP